MRTKFQKTQLAALCVSTALFGCGGEPGADLGVKGTSEKKAPTPAPVFDMSKVIILPSEGSHASDGRSASAATCNLGQYDPEYYYPLDGRIGHGVGYWEGVNCTESGCTDTWAVNVGSEVAGHMWYGPYERRWGGGRHLAIFAMDIDVADANGRDIVAVMDVVAGVGSVQFARSEIRRDAMKDCTMASGNLCYFGIYFENPCFLDIEARLYYRDTAALRVYWSSIRYDQTQPWPFAAQPAPRVDQ